jgi:hypothetical protein
MAAEKISHHDVERLLGDIDDHKVVEIIETGATLAELEEVAAHLALASDRMGALERPLTGRALRIFDLIRSEEERGEEDR